MKSTIDAGAGQLFDLKLVINLLDRFYPRLLTQIDRDPDSPTYGSCDRHYWMYRLNDFDSGVVQQAGLTLAALDRLADFTDFADCRYLDLAHRAYWRKLALAINRRNVRLLEANGFLDEYFPGERSFPATVFAGYATLKSAVMLGQQEIIDAPGLAAAAERLLSRPASPAANQDTAAAAFLALYGKTRNWKTDQVAAAAAKLLAGQDGKEAFGEYGGLDLGYATVSLNYLAYMVEDESYPAEGCLENLADVIADFVTPGGRLGGEFAARSTTYFLPFGLLQAAVSGGDPQGRFSLLDLSAAFDKLDDRYLIHYCLPSLALSGLKLARDGVGVPPRTNGQAGWITGDHSAQGLVVCRSAEATVIIGINKGGTVQAESAAATVIDCGYRARRGAETFATCVIDESPDFNLERASDGVILEVRAQFQRYATLTASPLKTVALRLLRFLGPKFNAYFKSRLIKSTQVLPGAMLKRHIRVAFDTGKVSVEDEIIGLRPDDLLHRAPPWSFRLVPSAKFYQEGEAEPLNDRNLEDILAERTFSRTIELDG